jgi:hypothetical protein
MTQLQLGRSILGVAVAALLAGCASTEGPVSGTGQTATQARPALGSGTGQTATQARPALGTGTGAVIGGTNVGNAEGGSLIGGTGASGYPLQDRAFQRDPSGQR